MSNATAKEVMRQAILQVGYRETGNNHTKFGKEFGMDGQSWCAIFEWWCGEHAPGKNPIAKAAKASDVQDLTVSQKNGKWVMKKTGSRTTKKEGLGKVKFADQVSFDFGANDLWRDHTAFAIGRIGNDYITVEGNTTPEGTSGSQTNGDEVAIKIRNYFLVCSIDRPDYGKEKKYVIAAPYQGTVPKLPKRGHFKVGDKGTNVKRLQKALNWAVDAEIKEDGVFKNETLFGVYWYQVQLGLAPDGKWGKDCLSALKKLIKKHATKKKKAKKKTKAQKINALAKACAYPKGTDSDKFKYPSGKPKEKYKETLAEAFPNRSGWDPQKKAGAKCEIYIMAVLRALGMCKKMPTGLAEMITYLEKHNDELKIVPSKKDNKGHYYSPSMLQGGDIVIVEYKGTGGHIFFIVEENGKLYISEAQWHGKTYPHVSKELKTMRKSSYEMLRVYRARG